MKFGDSVLRVCRCSPFALFALLSMAVSCSNAPPLRSQSWIEGHDGDVLTLSILSAGGETSSEDVVTTELQWVELEAYHKYNIGLFVGYDRSLLWGEERPGGVERELQLAIWSLGAVYSAPIDKHVDIGARAGLAFIGYDLIDVIPPPECVRVGSGTHIDVGASDEECFGTEDILAEDSAIGLELAASAWFPIWYYRAGVTLRWRFYGSVPESFTDLVGSSVDNMSIGILFHWLSFTSEERPL